MACGYCGFSAKKLTNGILQTNFGTSEIGYPDDGHEVFQEIEDKSFWFQHRNRVILSLLKMFPPAGVLIDVGGGNGFQAAKIQEVHPKTLLLEPGLRGCEFGRKRGVAQVVNSTLQALALKDEQVGAFCFFDVLEHLETPEELLAEAFRVLAPGGRIYITVPAFSSLWSHEDEYAHHERRYTAGSLQALLTRTGFRSEYLSYYFMVLVIPIALLRCIPYRLGLVKKKSGTEAADHRSDGLLSKLIQMALDFELKRTRSMRRIPFGSSILCVATKNPSP